MSSIIICPSMLCVPVALFSIPAPPLFVSERYSKMIVPSRLLISHGCYALLSIARAVSNTTLYWKSCLILLTGHQRFCAYSWFCHACLVQVRRLDSWCILLQGKAQHAMIQESLANKAAAEMMPSLCLPYSHGMGPVSRSSMQHGQKNMTCREPCPQLQKTAIHATKLTTST